MKSTLDYFLKYVKVDTQSDDNSKTSPSSKKQLVLSKMLLEDLKDLGISDSFIDEFGQVHAFIKGGKGLETIGLNAHIDTALELSGANVKPQIVNNYDGGDITLNDNYKILAGDFTILERMVGKTLITTSGDTLLGADDKAGLSIIMNVLKWFIDHPEVKHHPISVLFTCDEEIGRGAEHFDAKIFKAAYAYTIDGDSPYKANYENFNAAHAHIKIKGVSIHPGEAKNKMINASKVAIELVDSLNQNEVPEKTEKYEGFHHLTSINGTVDSAELDFIIRDHDKKLLSKKVDDLKNIIELLKKKYPRAVIEAEIGDDYKNMKEVFLKDRKPLEKIEKAYQNLYIPFEFEPIRGGTDGATFSFLGCPTPNLGTGSYNHHGRYEFLVKEEHDLMIEIVKEILKA
ncbi:MAG: peptidase T [Erysipelotrichaceae bacterium]|nr:peptidase T [Erysipelotrichaceae bacterium]